VRASSRAETEPWERTPPRPAGWWRAENENATPKKFGPYAVGELIGTGGLSTVHRACDRRALRMGCETALALKRLHPVFSTEWELVDAFLAEAQVASTLKHPNVARTFSYGKLDGTYYAAVELAMGPTLAEVMRQARSAAGAVPVGVVVEVMIQILDALDHLHNASPAIVHRDIVPANFIVSSAGRVKLIDFGVAKIAARRKTQQGIIKGTLAYVAPEYMLGQLDARVDLFAVGVIGHELLSGRSLFAGATDGATMRNVRAQRVQPPSRFALDVPYELDDIVMTALLRDPDQRWQNARAMRVALTEVARAMGGRLALSQLIREWLDFAFECPPRRDTANVRRMLRGL
jgi:eukaryotic-like serine/threonine-protein kinase